MGNSLSNNGLEPWNIHMQSDVLELVPHAVCFIRFKNSFDGRTQYSDTWIDNRHNRLCLMAPNEGRLPY